MNHSLIVNLKVGPKIHWAGLIFQGLMFKFNTAPRMYLDVFFELLEGREFPDGSRDFVPSF